ncbi:ATP-binding cassette, sub-B (MDR TAP), member 4, partial [Quaeritorhiza haematococci]
MNAPEWWLFVIGGIGAVANGLTQPIFALVFSSVLGVFADPDPRPGANRWALIFLAVGFGQTLAAFLQNTFFAISGEKLTKRIRHLCFLSLLSQEIGFFDEPEHATGVLVSRLGDDAAQIQGLAGPLLGLLVQQGVNLVAGALIAFVYQWELTLVVLASIPLTGLAGFFQVRALAVFGNKTTKAYNNANQVATEAVANIRTVAVLGKEKEFKKRYEANIEAPHKVVLEGAFVSSVGFGFSQSLLYFAFGLALWYGARIIIGGRSTSDPVLKSLFSVLFSAIAAAQAAAFAPNIAKARVSAHSIFSILDRTPRIPPYTSSTGSNLPKSQPQVQGNAAVEGARFRYPTRPNVPVLRGLDVTALKGQTVALVGASGSGKSTVISLLERFYDVNDGRVTVDDLDVKEWNIRALRSHLSLVGQEPVLFNLSIRDNIAYGVVDEEGEGKGNVVTNEQIEAAARMANIHEFVMGLPKGYDTIVGEK